ncbi:MAG: LysR family transcriptional regulator [Burkholderiales bacterium]|nr:LysR family transcriptional regulator [Burkholderiales bacterium]
MDADLGEALRDTRLLVLFDEIYRTGSMTRAAERLELSQPTASIWLAKLRRTWGDPLFVRTSAGMRPTPRADALIGPAREALALLRRLSDDEGRFEPATAQRAFRIAMTDASHVTLLPRILAHVRPAGPGIRLEGVALSSAPGRLLESGEVDLALGYLPGLEAGFHEQPIYRQDFVCLVRQRHPRIGASFSAREYREEAHVGILSFTSYPMLRDALRRQGIERRILLELPGFLGLASIVSATDLVATVPRTIGEAVARMGPIRVLPCPLTVPTFPVGLYWHARYHHDPGGRWLRGVCAKLLTPPGGPRSFPAGGEEPAPA